MSGNVICCYIYVAVLYEVFISDRIVVYLLVLSLFYFKIFLENLDRC